MHIIRKFIDSIQEMLLGSQRSKYHFCRFLRGATNGFFLLIALVLTYLGARQIIYTADMLFWTAEIVSVREVLSELFILILIVELLVAIRKYFVENYHFPIRFFVYLAITDLVRNIIIHHEDPKLLFWHAGSILLLIVGLSILDFKCRFTTHNYDDT